MLIVQDLAIVVLLTVLPVLENVREGLPELSLAVLKAAAFIAAMLLLGSRILPMLLARLAAWGSRELFLVSVVAIGVGVGYATYLVGLSFAFGAFMAGMVLSQSDYSHQALAEVEPLRDVFAMIFFVSIGLLIDPSYLWANFGTIVLVVVLILVVKGLIFGGLTRVFGYGNIVPFAVGLGLFQVGEFSFLLAREGISDRRHFPGDLLARSRRRGRHYGPYPSCRKARAGPLRSVPAEVSKRAPADLQPASRRASGPRRRRRVRSGWILRRQATGQAREAIRHRGGQSDPRRPGEGRGLPHDVRRRRGHTRSGGRRDRRARLVVLTIPDALAARLAVERLRGLAPKPISWYGPRAPGNSKTSAAWASTRRCSRSWRPAWSWRVRPSPVSGSQRRKPRLRRRRKARTVRPHLRGGGRQRRAGTPLREAAAGLTGHRSRMGTTVRGTSPRERRESGANRAWPPRTHHRGPRREERDRGVHPCRREGGRGDPKPRGRPGAPSRRCSGRPGHPTAAGSLPHHRRGQRRRQPRNRPENDRPLITGPTLPHPETTPDQWRIPVEFLHIIQPNGTRLCASCSVQHKKG